MLILFYEKCFATRPDGYIKNWPGRCFFGAIKDLTFFVLAKTNAQKHAFLQQGCKEHQF